MDETQPIPTNQPLPGDTRPVPTAPADEPEEGSLEETRPVPVGEERKGAPEEEVEPLPGLSVSSLESAEEAGQETTTTPGARPAQVFAPPPPPNWPDKDGWKIRRGEEWKGAAAPGGGRAPLHLAEEGRRFAWRWKDDPARPVQIQPTPSIPRAESVEPAGQEPGLLPGREKLSLTTPPPPVVGPASTETRPVPAQRAPVYKFETDSPAAEAPAQPLSPSTYPLPARTPASSIPEATTPSIQQSRLQRALTLFVLAAAVLMALGTVAVALSVYRPDLDFLAFFWPGGSGETTGESEAPAEQGAPIGEQLAERVPLGTPEEFTIRPTPQCVYPMLTLGEARFAIRSIQPEANGTIQVPDGEPGIVYWVTGTNDRYVFAISPDPGNLELMKLLKKEDPAIIVWANCDVIEFTLTEFSSEVPDPEMLLDQSIPGISIYIQEDSIDKTFVARGSVAGDIPTEETYPDFNPKEVEAEITLIESTVSEDNNSLIVTVSIYNFSSVEFALRETDVALIPARGRPILPSNSDPDLPRNVKPGATQMFELTFPMPSGETAILQIFTAEIDIEGY